VRKPLFSPGKYPTKPEVMLFSETASHVRKEAIVGMMFL